MDELEQYEEINGDQYVAVREAIQLLRNHLLVTIKECEALDLREPLRLARVQVAALTIYLEASSD